MIVGRPRQVAILIDSLSAGGAERIAVEAAAALDRDRYVPHLVVTRSSGPLEELVRARDVPLTVLDRKRAIAPAQLFRALKIVRRSTIVHAHLWGSGMWGALLARMARRPLIAHAHRFDADRSRGWMAGYRYWIAPGADRIICVSDEIAGRFADAGVPSEKLAVVPNGVVFGDALSRNAARAALGLRVDSLVIGMVARLRTEKRHDLALRALAQLRSRGSNAILCIVGDGERELPLRRLADQLGLDAFVYWAGPRDDAGRLVRGFDMTLICSDIEGMPLSALEALVEGTPIVSTRVGVMPELVKYGGGVLVDEGTPEAIADGLSRIIDGTAGLRIEESKAAARQQFDVERVAHDVAALYDEAVARRRGP